MDKTTLYIGISVLIIGGIIIFLSFRINQKNDSSIIPGKEKVKQLQIDIDAVIQNFSNFGTGYFTHNKSDVQKEAIRLKIATEQILGVEAESNVNIEKYERPTNSSGLEEVRTDLISLSRQLNNIQ